MTVCVFVRAFVMSLRDDYDTEESPLTDEEERPLTQEELRQHILKGVSDAISYTLFYTVTLPRSEGFTVVILAGVITMAIS